MLKNHKKNNKQRGYHWIIILLSGIILFFSGPGQTFNVSVFIDSYIESEGWSRSAISGFYSAATLAAGLLMPLSGRYIDKLGHRFMTPIIAGLLALSTLWISFTTAPWMLILGFFLIRLLGQGSMTLLASTLIPRWFNRKQGIALSLVAIGGVAGSAFIPLISNSLITNFGASFAWRFWAISLMIIMVPLAMVFIRNNPHDVGMAKDGLQAYEDDSLSAQQSLLSAQIELDTTSWTASSATKSRVFWMMLFCMVVPSMINTGITFHIVSIFALKGFPSSFAAIILGITAGIQFPIGFLAGWLCDRFPIHKIKAFNYLFLGLALIGLLLSQSVLFLILYAINHGIFSSVDSVSTGVWWPKNFGLKHLGTIRGMGMTAMVLGSALGPLPFGLAFDAFGDYQFIMYAMLIFVVLAFLAAYTSPPPRKI